MFNTVVGFLMGIANLIPGVSAGTVALLGGVYDKLIHAISDFLSLKLSKGELLFLIEIVVGIVVGLVGFSHLVETAIVKFPSVTYGVFTGLVIGGIPFVFSQTGNRRKSHWLNFFIGVFLVILLSLPGEATKEAGKNILEHSPAKLSYDIFAGMIGSSSMILPGVSGAFILLLLGEYHRAIAAINALDVYVILTIGFGIILGIALISKMLNMLLERKRTATFMFLAGLMSGSIPDLLLRPVVFNFAQILMGISAGIVFSLYFSRIGKKIGETRTQ